MKTLKLIAAALAAILAAGLFGGAASALANAALDQYVEQIPTPRGNTDWGEKPPTKKLDPVVDKKLRSSGDEGSQLGQVAAATAPDVATAPVEADADPVITQKKSKKRADKPGKSKPSKKGDGQEKGDSAAQLNGLMGEESPGTAESLSAAASASGINSPLAVFVVLVAIVMGTLALRRRLKGGQA